MEHSSCGHASQDTLNMEHCVLIKEGLLCVAPEQILLIRKKKTNENVTKQKSYLTMSTRVQEIVLNGVQKSEVVLSSRARVFRLNHLLL